MAEKENLILTAAGPDRVGLVEMISEFVFKHGCNIEDSKMAVFCGEFALILLISGSGQDLAEIGRGYRDLEHHSGLNIWVKTPSPRRPADPSRLHRLRASCLDHPGVVYRLTGILSGFGTNIESMETKTYPAPITGTPIFRLEAVVAVPAAVNIEALRARLDEFAKGESIDMSFVASAPEKS